MEVGKRLVTRKYAVHLLTMNANTLLPPEEWIQGIHVIRFKVNWQGLWIYPTAILNGSSAFRTLLRKIPLDIIHFHLPFSAMGILLSSQSKKFPRIFSFYGLISEEMVVELEDKELSVIKGLLYRKLYLKALSYSWKYLQGKCLSVCDKVTVLSEYSREQVLSLPYAPFPSDIVLIPGGVDTEKFQPFREQKDSIRVKLGLPHDGLLLLSIRRLVPRMGLENLIRAMQLVLKENPSIYLVIGGKGPLEGRLRAMIPSLGLDNKVILTGFIPEDLLPLYYQTADLFVLPTIALEGFGLPVIEAMACGLPVIATPIGAPMEILSRFDPSLVASGTSPEDLADSILNFVSHKAQDPCLALRCRAFVENDYSWENVVDDYEKLYSQVAKTK